MERRFAHYRQKYHHLNRAVQYSTATTTQHDSAASNSFLQSRDIFHHTTPVKVDSDAGATGTSVAQLPGRHFIVPPWLALLVWSFILFFIVLTIAGFVLSYQARKEFRMRVEEQRKAQSEAEQGASECKIPMTKKEFKSFTRKSIMILNTNSPRVRNHPNHAYGIDNSGGIRPRNMFDRPPRESILVAEITPSGNFTGDDPFSEFSRQMRREGLWDLAARKSKAISVLSLSSVVPKMRRMHSNRFTMMDMAEEENEPSFHSSPHKDNLSRPPNSRALRYLEAAQGPDVRVEEHLFQSNRFTPSVPKLPVQFAKEQLDTSETLSSFDDITILSFNHDKQSSLIDDETTLIDGTICLPQRLTSRRGSGTQEPTIIECANSRVRSVNQLSPPERSTSLRAIAAKGSDKQSGSRHGQGHEPTETSDLHVIMTAPMSNVSPDDAVALYASARAAAPSPFLKNDVSPDHTVVKYASARAGTPTPMPKSNVSPDDAIAKYASSRAGTPSPMPQSDLSPDDAVAKYASSRAGTPSPIPQSDLSPDDTIAKYASSRASTPFPMPQIDISPDDAVAKYASVRAGAISPFPSIRRSSSVLGFIRRSLTPTPNQSLDGRESPAPSTQMMTYIESATEPLPMTRRSGDFQLPPLNQSSFIESEDEFCKPFSVIIEEEEEDYFHHTRATSPPFLPSQSSFWDTLQAGSPDTANIPLPRRLPQAALGRTPSHASRFRSHTVNPQDSTSVAMIPTSSTSKATSSSHGARSRSGSPRIRGFENSHYHPTNQPPSPASLMLKRDPSLPTHPYGRFKKQVDLNQHLPLSPRHHLNRYFSEQQSRPVRRNPSNPIHPHGSSQDKETLNPNGASGMRRTASAQARIPLSGTMSSGGVRNSSFVP